MTTPRVKPRHLDIAKMQDLTGMVRKSDKYYFAFGGLADLWRGEWTKDTEHSKKATFLAIKVIRSTWNDPDYLARLKTKLIREGNVWSTLSHPNITPFFGVCFDLDRPSTPSLICPYYSNGDAPSYLLRHPEADRRLLVTQVAAGLAYLHRLQPKPIVHGDVKGTNILINDKGEASITDFGLSRILETSGFTTKSSAGTCRWMAYELLAFESDGDDDDTPPATIATDVWAFAMTVIEILTDRLPFHHLKYDSAVILTIMKHGRPSRESNPEVTDDVWSVLARCWNDDPQARPSMASLGLFFDITNSQSSAHRCLADSEIARILGSDISTSRSTAGSGAILAGMRSFGRSVFGNTAARQRQREDSSNDGNTRNRLSLSLTRRASKIPENQPESLLPYRCNWPNCPEGFDTLSECQSHELGHQTQWEFVGT